MFEFRLPDLGEGIHEGEVLRWHVRPGEVIPEDAPLIDVETDKAAVTIPSPRSGRVVELRAQEGDTVRVGQVLVVLDVGDASTSPGTGAVPPSRTDEAVGTAQASADIPAPAKRSEHRPVEPAPPVAAANLPLPRPGGGPGTGGPLGIPGRVLRVAAAPATRRLARELGVDIRQVPGSGPGGRVTPEDVRAVAAAPTPALATAVPRPEDPEVLAAPVPVAGSGGIPYLDLQPLPDFGRWGDVLREPVRSIRRKVARNTVTAMILIPHVAHMDEADVTDLEAFRRRENARRGPEATRLTLLAFAVRAVTIALKRHPVFNASLDPFREEIVFKRYFHVGIAVDTDRGLIVPNLKDADRRPIAEIASAIEDLARRAREGGIQVEELQGGTFTITNIGVLGGTSFVPAIHYPESAILGMGRAIERPVVRDGQVVVRTMLPMTLSFDHRIADGAEAARFLGLVRDLLQDPVRLAVEG
ncbi:MAG TPA: dihydrolipoamide acetyltransferase family protein [Myxococcota bacterium]|nr:dihydrolipoamide acetyltransferase family protein [Myxococcota bacterium]HQK50750.1 dihydrolipoamide acetyltransferase family protein [Myxococcota bacterium]